MDFKIIWSDQAIGDLQDIRAYIARENPQAAKRIGKVFWIMFLFWPPFHVLDRRIQEARKDHCEKLSSVRIGFSMMSLKILAVWKSFTFDIVLATNQISKQ